VFLFYEIPFNDFNFLPTYFPVTGTIPKKVIVVLYRNTILLI